MAELTQKTLGLVRDVLFEMEPEGSLTSFEKSKFWKEALFDAGFPQAFIVAARSYDFRWTDIVPDLFTAKFRDRRLGKSIPPALCEQFLGKLVRFAHNAESSLGDALQGSLADDGFYSPSVQTQTPMVLAKLPTKESLLKDLGVQITDRKLVSVAFIDLDNFKQVNDQHGHSEGDKCLVEVVGQLSAAISGKGRLYRVGGDEFCILLPNFSSSEAAATAERIRAGVDSLKPLGGTVKVTTSIGVASSELPTATDAESLYVIADKTMYVSKGTGKNRVTIAPSKSEGERQPATAPRETQQERKRRMRNQVAEFLKQGQQILDGIEYSNIAAVQEKPEWKLTVQQYLAENLDESYAVRFASPKHRVLEFPLKMMPTMRVHWGEVRSKMDMLHDFFADLRD